MLIVAVLISIICICVWSWDVRVSREIYILGCPSLSRDPGSCLVGFFNPTLLRSRFRVAVCELSGLVIFTLWISFWVSFARSDNLSEFQICLVLGQ